MPIVPATRRRFLAAGAALVLSAAFAAPALAQAAGARNKVVLQVSDADPAKWNLALNNAANLQKDLGIDDVEVEIVAYGPGIGMLKAGSPVGARVSSALQSNVRVVACQNTMAGQHLQKSDMLPDIGYVPAGVVEIMKKQQQGWAYIRP
jgi:intracellular sulfur oxidation DsrE/DsrF family protein